ncbi:periplasmic binding protein-like I [Entophlyctis helioformis]|nr:periplasmic binding protein-like I [Entophlyctis helioformis]
MIGSEYSYISKPTAIVASTRNLPQCDGSSSSPDLSDKSIYPNFFRAIPSDNLQGKAIFDFVLRQGWRRIAILNEAEGYGTGLMRVITTAAQGSPVSILSQQTFPLRGMNNKTDWDPYFKSITDLNLYVIVLIMSDVGHLFTRARELGLTSSKYVWVTSEGVLPYIDDTYPAGMISFSPTGGYGPQNEAFKQAWRDNAWREPYVAANAADEPLFFMTNFASCVELLLRGFDDYLTNTSSTVQSLASGSLTAGFPKPHVMFGKFGQTMLPVGTALIDENGDPLMSYDIYNMLPQNQEVVLVGSWDAQTRKITLTRDIIYPSGLTKTPLDNIDPYDYLFTIGLAEWPGGLTFAANILMMILLLGLFDYHIVYQNDRKLKATSVESQMFIITGLILACFDVLTMIGTPTMTTCVADIWILGLAFPLVLGALTVKLARIWVIINGLSPLRFLLQHQGLILSTGILVGVDAIILAAWCAIDAPRPLMVSISPTKFQWVCTSTSARLQQGFSLALVVWNSLLLAACTCLAIATRNVQSEFNEAKYIGIAVYNQVVILVFAMPILLTASTSMEIKGLYLIKQGALIIIVGVTIVSLFGRQMYNAVAKATGISVAPQGTATSGVGADLLSQFHGTGGAASKPGAAGRSSNSLNRSGGGSRGNIMADSSAQPPPGSTALPGGIMMRATTIKGQSGGGGGAGQLLMPPSPEQGQPPSPSSPTPISTTSEGQPLIQGNASPTSPGMPSSSTDPPPAGAADSSVSSTIYRFTGKYKEPGGMMSLWISSEMMYFASSHILVFRQLQLSRDGKTTRIVSETGLSKTTVLFVSEVKGLMVGEDMNEPTLMLRTKAADVGSIRLDTKEQATQLADLVRAGITEGIAAAMKKKRARAGTSLWGVASAVAGAVSGAVGAAGGSPAVRARRLSAQRRREEQQDSDNED